MEGQRVTSCVAHGPYVEAVVAAIETAGLDVEAYDYEVERSLTGVIRAGSINIGKASAGVFARDQCLTLLWDDQWGWRFGVYRANGKGGYNWLLPVPAVATPDEVVAALLTARSGAPLAELPGDVPPARDSAADARFEAALAAYR